MSEKVLTENPYDEMWVRLSYFKSIHNCYEYFKKYHPNKKDREKRASLLRYYIKQAHEYYISSQSVSSLTKPTLLYYGALCLSRALILAKRGYPDETKSHGLSSNINNDLKDDLFHFKLKSIEKGTFVELYETISSDSNSSFEDIKKPEWTMMDLFSMIPEIKNIYEETLNKKSQIIQIDRFYDEDGEYIKINEKLFGNLSESEIDTFLNNIYNLNKYYLKRQIINDNQLVLYKRPENGDIVQKNIMLEEYLVSGLKKEENILILPEIMLHVMILYSLSMMSRYHVYEWGINNFEDKTGFFYLIENFLKISERKFPNMILNQLLHEEYIFTTELYRPAGINFEENKKQFVELIKEHDENK